MYTDRAIFMRKATIIFAFYTTFMFAASLQAQVQFVTVAAESRQQLAELLPQNRFRADYGTFIGVEATQAEIDRMTAAGIEAVVNADAGNIQFMKWHFDPLKSPPFPAQCAPKTDQATAFISIQFRGPIRQEWLDQIRDTGLTLVQYYPSNAYLVWGPASSVAAAENAPAVRWTGGFLPEYRISPSLSNRDGVVEKRRRSFHQ